LILRRAVVNVGTGRYRSGSERLRAEVSKYGEGCAFFSWSDPLPEEWPKHSDKMYAFKAHALAASVVNAEVLLWCDSAVVPVRSMEPLWEKIERDGYYVPLNGWVNADWTADSAYDDLFPGVPIEQAREMNKIPHAVATAFGINTRSEVGAEFLREYYRLSNTDAFKGPWSNTRNPNHWNYHPDMMGDCGPENVLGHRHDQSSLSVIAHRLGMTMTQCPEFFAYPPGAENTVLLAIGA
jgi:hypothetical protein